MVGTQLGKHIYVQYRNIHPKSTPDMFLKRVG